MEGVGVDEVDVEFVALDGPAGLFEHDFIEVHSRDLTGVVARGLEREAAGVAAQVDDFPTGRQLGHLDAVLALVAKPARLVALAGLDAVVDPPLGELRGQVGQLVAAPAIRGFDEALGVFKALAPVSEPSDFVDDKLALVDPTQRLLELAAQVPEAQAVVLADQDVAEAVDDQAGQVIAFGMHDAIGVGPALEAQALAAHAVCVGDDALQELGRPIQVLAPPTAQPPKADVRVRVEERVALEAVAFAKDLDEFPRGWLGAAERVHLAGIDVGSTGDHPGTEEDGGTIGARHAGENSENEYPPDMAPQLFLDLAALVGGTVLTMGGGPTEPITAEVATVLIDGPNVIAIGPDLELPPGTVQHDVSGHFILPGLIDGFAQFDGEHDALYTAAGVTTVRDVGGDRARLLELRRKRDGVPGPRLLTAGVVLGGDPPASPEAAVFRHPPDVDRLLPLLIADQVDFLSIFPNMPADAWKRTIELGLENGLATWGPTGPSVGMDLAACIEAGQKGIFYLDALLPDGIQWDVVQPLAFRKTIEGLAGEDVHLVPMLGATAARLEVVEDDAADFERFFQYLGSHYVSWWRTERDMRRGLAGENETFLATGERVLGKQQKTLKMLFDAGVSVLPGSGAPHPWLLPGPGLVRELELWEAAGVPRGAILYAATRGAAEAFAIGSSRGQVRVGGTADLVVLSADPREAIANLYAPAYVVVRGEVLDRAELDELLAVQAGAVAARLAEETAPMEVAPPDLPEGAVVLQGFVQNMVRDTRVSAERWAVVRMADGTLAFCGRVVTPSEGGFRGTDMNVVQKVKDGALVEFELTLGQGADELVCTGVWTAERFQISRRLNNVFIDNKRSPEHAVTVDVGSITSALVVAHLEQPGYFPVIKMHESFEGEVVGWELGTAEGNLHLLRTSTGGLVAGFDAKGAPVRHDMRNAEFVSQIEVLESTSFGGPGLPVPTKPVTIPSQGGNGGTPPEDGGGE